MEVFVYLYVRNAHTCYFLNAFRRKSRFQLVLAWIYVFLCSIQCFRIPILKDKYFIAYIYQLLHNGAVLLECVVRFLSWLR